MLIDARGHAVLGDYELVFITTSPDFINMISSHTLQWTAPELMKDCDEDTERVSAPYSLASDVFAFAMTVIEVRPNTSDARAADFLIHVGLYRGSTFRRKKMRGCPSSATQT